MVVPVLMAVLTEEMVELTATTLPQVEEYQEVELVQETGVEVPEVEVI
jgi:hypothetical protein